MEAVWQSVQQKAADELVGIASHHFGPAVRTVVFPGKADVPVGEREQPAVNDGGRDRPAPVRGLPTTQSRRGDGAHDPSLDAFQLFKFNATGVVVGDITVVQTFAGQTLQANTGAFNGDGTGPFSFGISCT